MAQKIKNYIDGHTGREYNNNITPAAPLSSDMRNSAGFFVSGTNHEI